MRKPSKKLIASAKEEKDNTLTTLELFLRTLSELYPKDPSAPGLVLSFLPSGMFYASVARYDETNGRHKQILLQNQEPTLKQTIEDLAMRWVQKTEATRKFQALIAPAIKRQTKARRRVKG